MDILEGLNDAQRTAVQTTEGPLLLLAGAGSGKTKTLTHRIAYLLTEKNVWPHEILAVTFTNKAAKEMRERLWKLTSAGSSPSRRAEREVHLSQNSELRTQNTSPTAPPRNFMPWMGTFHGICVRMLRQDGEAISIAKNFVIYDEDDRQGLIKQVMKQLSIANATVKPRAVSAAISTAKNELLSPQEYADTAHYPFQQAVAKIYTAYETARQTAGALDFDDLLIETVRLLRESLTVREKYRRQFRYILIDEYQDTNAAQYAIVKLLVGEAQNICVVGDDWQCFPEGTPIKTPDGDRQIEQIAQGQTVTAPAGYGKVAPAMVTNSRSYDYEGDLIAITTASGRCVRVTPNHLLFGRFHTTNRYFVYLMHSEIYGYRVGIAKGTRYDGKKDAIGLRVRANQERASRMWVIKMCDTRAEANYQEAYVSYQYGVPMMRFRASLKGTSVLTQQQIDELYRSIDTTSRATALMRDHGLHPDYPHFIPQATTRGQVSRVVVNLVLFGDRRVSTQSPWSASRLSLNTTYAQSLDVFKQQGLSVRAGRAGTWRAEKNSLDFGSLERFLAGSQSTTIQVSRSSFMTKQKYLFLPASQLHPGMQVPTWHEGQLIDDIIVECKKEFYRGKVYDLDIANVHSYIADDVAVHNSIYSWRGADFKNILRFEHDFPGAVVVKLEQNYRSTSAILEAAHNVISKNIERTDKVLWTEVGKGMPVQVHAVYDELEEAYTVASRIAAQVAAGTRRFSDFAVLYRTNAQSFAFERTFLQHRIPYQLIGGVRFYDRKEIKDIIAYLRLLYQPQDIMSFSRIVNVPTRGIGETSFEKFITWQASSGLDVLSALLVVDQVSTITARARQSLYRLGETMRTLQVATMQQTNPGELIEKLIEQIGYRQYILDGSPQAEDREANLNVLVNDAKLYASLSDLLEEVALMSSVDTVRDESAVTLMTLHAAKGLEFPVVYMVGMEDGLFPSQRALEEGPRQLEEERRLCYVGMTRAREELYLTYTQSRMQFGMRGYAAPSRFLEDMGHEVAMRQPAFVAPPRNEYDEVVNDFEVGDQVQSPQFGEGEIIDVDGLAVTVQFVHGATKKLNIEYARLQRR